MIFREYYLDPDCCMKRKKVPESWCKMAKRLRKCFFWGGICEAEYDTQINAYTLSLIFRKRNLSLWNVHFYVISMVN